MAFKYSRLQDGSREHQDYLKMPTSPNIQIWGVKDSLYHQEEYLLDSKVIEESPRWTEI
jgi:hypothetical protein